MPRRDGGATARLGVQSSLGMRDSSKASLRLRGSDPEAGSAGESSVPEPRRHSERIPPGTLGPSESSSQDSKVGSPHRSLGCQQHRLQGAERGTWEVQGQGESPQPHGTVTRQMWEQMWTESHLNGDGPAERAPLTQHLSPSARHRARPVRRTVQREWHHFQPMSPPRDLSSRIFHPQESPAPTELGHDCRWPHAAAHPGRRGGGAAEEVGPGAELEPSLSDPVPLFREASTEHFQPLVP